MSEAFGPHPAIPLSLPSPPAEAVKEGSKAHSSDHTPHSPASPYMSVATKSYGQPFAKTQASSVPSAPHRSPTPPVSAPMSTQVSQEPSMIATASFPTPENSVIGQARKVPDEFDEAHASKRQRIDNGNTSAPHGSCQEVVKSPVSLSVQNEIESHASPQQLPASGNMVEFQLQQALNQTREPASIEMSLEQLQKNVGEAFHLCKSAIPRIRPDPSQHLLSRYGLSDLHAKVARTDPVTHEKINKLRKSYEGQIKTFALAGRNKPTKDEIPEGQWSSLNMMMLEPEESWYASKVMGKKIEKTPDFEARLQRATFLQPGRTRDHEQWEDVLGHEKPRTAQGQDLMGKKLLPGTLHRRQVNGSTARTMSQAGGEAVRPRRSGKKRSYADNSFEGYGDGFVDDEVVDMDQSFLSNSEDGSHGAGRRKRKKDHSLSSSANTYGEPSSYGAGNWNGADR